jgi:peptidyl-prolyl cis-trans isomerase C
MDEVFFDAAYALSVAEVSAPIRTPFGFHVLQAIEPGTIVVPTYEQAKGRLAAEARREAEKTLVEQLRKRISVDVHRVPAAGEGG